MTVVEPSQPDEGSTRLILLFEMLTIDSLPSAARGQRGCAIKVGIYGLKQGKKTGVRLLLRLLHSPSVAEDGVKTQRVFMTLDAAPWTRLPFVIN
jgi:hypothetical protein